MLLRSIAFSVPQEITSAPSGEIDRDRKLWWASDLTIKKEREQFFLSLATLVGTMSTGAVGRQQRS